MTDNISTMRYVPVHQFAIYELYWRWRIPIGFFLDSHWIVMEFTNAKLILFFGILKLDCILCAVLFIITELRYCLAIYYDGMGRGGGEMVDGVTWFSVWIVVASMTRKFPGFLAFVAYFKLQSAPMYDDVFSVVLRRATAG